MITDSDRYNYQKSTYERPTFPYVCGRACEFGKPCSKGPNFDGSCGGVTECTPYRNGDRWECRRPQSAGGPCEDGPLPDGTCCMQRPPCTPQPSLRRRRGKITMMVVVTIIALIGAFLTFDKAGFTGTGTIASSLMPGELSRAHTSFALQGSDKGCQQCHEAHGQGVGKWVEAFFTKQDVSNNCVDCHTFGDGTAKTLFTAHNAQVPDGVTPLTKTCVQCHTEHKGLDGNIKAVADAQCNTCHSAENQITNAAFDHPAFGSRFPHKTRPSIAFDHVKHAGEHFERKSDKAGAFVIKDKDGKLAGLNCVSCHKIDGGKNGIASQLGVSIKPTTFDAMCADCHEQGIRDRSLTLINLPAFEEDPFDVDEVAETCGLTPEQVEYLQGLAEGDEPDEVEFDDVFFEDNGDAVTAVLALAMAIEDDPESFAEPMTELLTAMAENGAEPFMERIGEIPGVDDSAQLLAGLDGEMVKRVACAWMQKREYEAPAGTEAGGWSADEVSISYKPSGHADPIAKAWFDLAVNAPVVTAAEGDGDREEAAEALKASLLSKDGLGNCTKCHAVTQVTDKTGKTSDGAEMLKVEWGYEPANNRPYVRYDHGPHVNLLGPGTACATCHQFDEKADFAASFAQHDASTYNPNFKAIEMETCASCHQKGQVRNDCMLCHEYHLEPGFRFGQTAAHAMSPAREGG